MGHSLLAALALLALSIVPGYVFARALRVPRQLAFFVSPAVTLLLVGVISLIFHVVGVRWSLLSFGLALAGSAGGGYFVTMVRALRFECWPPIEPVTRRQVAFITAAIAILVVPMLINVDFGLPSSAADPMYHYNAIRAIAHHGDASILGAMQANYGIQTIPVHYPATWHALVSLLGATSPVIASHAFAYLVIPILWVLALSFLARVSLPAHSAVYVPLLATVLVSFPTFLTLARGFWPNALAISQIPTVLAVIVLAWRHLRAHPRILVGDVVKCAVVILGLLGGLGLTHPSAVFSVVWALIPAALYAVVRAWGSHSASERRRVLLAAAGLVLFGVALTCPATVRGYIFRKHPRTWHTGERLDALRGMLADQPLVVPVVGAIGLIAVVIALAYAVRAAWRLPSLRWVVLAWLAQWLLVFGAYVNGNVFAYAAGIWYHDPHRLLSVQSIFTALILGALFARRTRRRVRQFGVVAVGLLASLAQFLVGWSPSQPPIGAGKMMTASDFDFFTHLDRHVARDALVLGDPASGLGYAPVYSGVDTVFTQVNRTAADHDGTYLAKYFDQIHADPTVCSILQRYGINYFYQVDEFVFQKRQRTERWPGLYGVDTSVGFDHVVSTERGTLWKISACGEGTAIPWWDTVSRRTPLVSERTLERKSQEMPARR
ncbi:hypothetical protein X956_02625 [Trueperella pyogenes TP8]|uniref:DUF6541 family protein n=1 Tax=Trueperella pyogenes TaxID=1661 RepID=UPI00057C38D3|nr:DUF6541 family protein [Trueperella pyogenes]AJC70456.1 hypothetical protein X956_02625 [Trueperella pyogenes TP8]